MVDQGWVAAGELQVGDLIRRADGREGMVQAVVVVRRLQPMYNLTVEQAHTYFVGVGRWLVHNTCRSIIHDDPRLIKQAEVAGNSHQKSLDNLVHQLNEGNMNPGIGTKHLFSGVYEARARDGARVYFRNAADGTVEILAKSTKSNQDKVIDILRELYE